MNVVAKLTPCNFKKVESNRFIDMIVLHSTASENVQGVIAHFHNPESKVSAHYVIDTDGTVYKIVNMNDVAWHAPNYNSRSIGIELVQTPQTKLTMVQKFALFELVYTIVSVVKTVKYLNGHFEIQENKIDPYDKWLPDVFRKLFELKSIKVAEKSGTKKSQGTL